MEHDHEGCYCKTNNCIMGPSSSFPHPRHWSSCSIKQLQESLQHGLDYCLLNKPKTLFRPSCGNGIIDDGEECDCGLPEFCNNKCCDAATCKLKNNAKCAIGNCCDKNTCLPISKRSEFVCRKPKSICDKAEFCDGVSEHCPPDKFVRDGTECLEGYAYCFRGKCETREGRCHLLWGNSSQVANYRCYQNNANANSSGNCGFDKRTKTYIKCNTKEDILCGRLHCTNNHRKLTLRYGPEGSTVISQVFDSPKETITCFSALIDLGLDDDDVGLVPNGAKCGLDKMCVHQKCVSVLTYEEACEDDTCEQTSKSPILIIIYTIFFIFLPILSLVLFFLYSNQKITKNWFRKKAFIARDYNNRRQKRNVISSQISKPIETELTIKPVRVAPPPPIPRTNINHLSNGVANSVSKKNPIKTNVTRPKRSPPKPPTQQTSDTNEHYPKVKDLVGVFEKQ